MAAASAGKGAFAKAKAAPHGKDIVIDVLVAFTQ